MKANITSSFMETCGSNTLYGSMIDDLVKPHKPEETKVTLMFHQTSYQWRKDNGGPDSWIMPEFAVMCLVKDVIHLISQGYEVEVEEELKLWVRKPVIGKKSRSG